MSIRQTGKLKVPAIFIYTVLKTWIEANLCEHVVFLQILINAIYSFFLLSLPLPTILAAVTNIVAQETVQTLKLSIS